MGRGFETPDQVNNFTEEIPFVLLTLEDKPLDLRQTKHKLFYLEKFISLNKTCFFNRLISQVRGEYSPFIM